ncbi:hypothetical protein EBT16_11390, partial [bacterium]|nr:hypothetical protein [bacterium]
TEEQVSHLKRWTSGEAFKNSVGKLESSGIGFTHSCFSKHLAILQACEKNGWSLDSYRSIEHPYHSELAEILSSLLGKRKEAFEFVVDGCKLPTPVLRMDEMARLFQKLVQGGKSDPSLLRIRDWMISNPDWIGGPKRIDSRLMRDNPGLLVAKEGADGLLAIGVLPSPKWSEGLGIVVKLAGGYQPVPAALALKPVLDNLGLQCNVPIPEGQTLQYHFRPWEQPREKWIDISPLLNAKIAVWPEDTPFARDIALDTATGDPLSLSSIRTSLHVGAHTDSPLHFGKGKKGIDQVDVTKYHGLCQIIEVKKNPHTEIKPEDVTNVEIVTPRVLFKTNSYPDPSQFNRDFNALSPELVEHLAKLGVVLVGIDTPSIDLFESKELRSHHATLANEMAILEGIDLRKVEPGIYELRSIPLRIEGGDASPVRALLRSPTRPSEF